MRSAEQRPEQHVLWKVAISVEIAANKWLIVYSNKIN